MSDWFGAGWSTVGWVVLTTMAMYAATVLSVRLAGRRTVAQLSAFDAVVTIAIGSIIAGTVLSPDPSLAQGVAALVTLLSLQVVVAALRLRSSRLSRLLEFEPEVVARDGVLHLPTALLSSQLTDQELGSLLRQRGIFDLRNVAVAVLEPDGSISVVRTSEPTGPLVP